MLCLARAPVYRRSSTPDLFDPAKHLIDSANVGEPVAKCIHLPEAL
jgi:hypothetical protein